MQLFDYIFFDLDGTIFNSEYGITRSVKYALKKFDIDDITEITLMEFIGPPLKKSFMDLYGFTDEEARQAIIYYREFYLREGIFRGEIYKGIEKMLAYINAHGKKVVLATSKPEEYAKLILKHFEIDKYFEHVSGASLDERTVEKYDVILNAIEAEKITDRSRILMVGDRKYDIEGAKQAGIKSVGVTYGFGSEPELRLAGADYIVSNVKELVHVIMLDE